MKDRAQYIKPRRGTHSKGSNLRSHPPVHNSETNNFRYRINLKDVKKLKANLIKNGFKKSTLPYGIKRFSRAYDNIIVEHYDIDLNHCIVTGYDISFEKSNLNKLYAWISTLSNRFPLLIKSFRNRSARDSIQKKDLPGKYYALLLSTFKPISEAPHFLNMYVDPTYKLKGWLSDMYSIIDHKITGNYPGFFRMALDPNNYETGKDRGSLFIPCKTKSETAVFYDIIRLYNQMTGKSFLFNESLLKERIGRPDYSDEDYDRVYNIYQKNYKKFKAIHNDIVASRSGFRRLTYEQVTKIAVQHDVGTSLVKDIETKYPSREAQILTGAYLAKSASKPNKPSQVIKMIKSYHSRDKIERKRFESALKRALNC